MTGPVDREYDPNITFRSSPVTFQGNGTASGATVKIFAWNFSTSAWNQVGTTTTGGGASSWQGYDWYEFSTSLTLANSYWTAGAGGGYRAQVRAEFGSSSTDMMTVRGDWATCFADNFGSIDDVYYECQAPESPVSNVMTYFYNEGTFHAQAATSCSGFPLYEKECRDKIVGHGPLFATGTTWGNWYDCGHCWPI